MKKFLSTCCLIATAIIFESSIINGNGKIPPEGTLFNDYRCSITETLDSEDGIGWTIRSFMRVGTMYVSFSVSGGGASATEGVTLSSYNSVKAGALDPNQSGLVTYTIGGYVNCNYSSSEKPPYGSVEFYYYKSNPT